MHAVVFLFIVCWLHLNLLRDSFLLVFGSERNWSLTGKWIELVGHRFEVGLVGNLIGMFIQIWRAILFCVFENCCHAKNSKNSSSSQLGCPTLPPLTHACSPKWAQAAYRSHRFFYFLLLLPARCATTTAANGTAAPPAPAPLSLSLAFIDCCSRHWPIPRQGRLSCLFAHHSLTYVDAVAKSLVAVGWRKR